MQEFNSINNDAGLWQRGISRTRFLAETNCTKPRCTKNKISSLVGGLLLTMALWQGLSAGMVYTKAELAQYLIAGAWKAARISTYHSSSKGVSQVDGKGLLINAKIRGGNFSLGGVKAGVHNIAKVKPWPWADTWPVAKLDYVDSTQAKTLYVLAGAQGNSLAFGPGHLSGSTMPGKPGVSVLGGHRDTHFAFLKDISLGDKLTVTPLSGQQVSYTVVDASIHNSLSDSLLASRYASQLILVTCYPFDAIRAGGPLRYVVTAELDRQEYPHKNRQAVMTRTM